MRYLISLLAIVLFLLQTGLVLKGDTCISKYWNPVWILFSGLVIMGLYFFASCRDFSSSEAKQARSWHYVIPLLLFAALIFEGIGLHLDFLKFPHPDLISDVNPQLETLMARALKGQQPYYSMSVHGTHPYPVYMPMHWLPIAIPTFLGIDPRWTGFIGLGVIVLLFAWIYRKTPLRLIPILFACVVINWFIYSNGQDLAVTYELLIAAYYLFLAAAISKDNIVLITIGVICCLLSRYTFVFWCPGFAILLWVYGSKSKSYLLWGWVIAACCGLYIFPFLLRDPSILRQGLIYHNNAAIYDWNGSGNPPISWTHENGISFASMLENIIPGTGEKQVMVVREIQAGIMILIFIAGVYCYRFFKGKMSVTQYSLPMLYLVMMLFYLFSPLTYRYYWISPLLIAGFLAGKIVQYSIRPIVSTPVMHKATGSV